MIVALFKSLIRLFYLPSANKFIYIDDCKVNLRGLPLAALESPPNAPEKYFICMLRCYILDDEPLAVKGLELLIESIPYLEVAGTSNEPFLALEEVPKLKPDILFLDIEMNGLSGLEFLATASLNCQVILTSAFPEYAVESYNFDVLDYLVKPISKLRFVKAVEKARKTVELSLTSTADWELNEIFIKADRQFHRVPLKDILFIEGLKDYVQIQCAEKKLTVSMNLKNILEQLPDEHFARINKSTIINIHQIQRLDSEIIYLENFPPFSLGRTYRDEFLKQYIEIKAIKRN